MRITEIFHSLQGEGPETGKRTAFVRTARCNLRCAWCDTPYSFGEGTEMSVEEVLGRVRSFRTRNVCLTGGEPLLQAESLALLARLSEEGYRTVVETGGSLDISPCVRIPGVTIDLDVKCPGSGMEKTLRRENLRLLRTVDCAKFVIRDKGDYEYAKDFLSRNPLASEVVFQPVWGTRAADLAEWVLGDSLDVRVMLQEHKHIWGDVKGR